MRNLNQLNQYRLKTNRVLGYYGNLGDHTCGVFEVPSPIDYKPLHIVASAGEGWDHVSVSRPNRCPNWPEMDYVKRTFFEADEVVMQLHVAEDRHISVHPYCLHLWRPHDLAIPLPPADMVG